MDIEFGLQELNVFVISKNFISYIVSLALLDLILFYVNSLLRQISINNTPLCNFTNKDTFKEAEK